MGLEWDPDGDAERRKESRGRLIATIGITVAVLGFGISKLVAHQRQQRDEQTMREIADLQQSERMLHPSPLSDLSPEASTEELDSTTRDVCRRLLACGAASGGGGSGDPAAVERMLPDCVRAQEANATTSFARGVLVSANRAVLASCGSMSCDQFPNCYMDTLRALSGAPPAKPVDPAVRKELVALVCRIAVANAGRVPDLNAPDASPDIRRLKQLMADLNDVSAVADLMKEAMATCGT